MVSAYFDCFSGIAGDMILGAFVDLGMSIDFLKSEIKKIDLIGYSIHAKKIKKNKFDASDVTIIVHDDQPHRTYEDIKTLINNSSLEKQVKKRSIEIFYNLAVAEGKVHNVDPEHVHFHEVGAVDSIIDIVGSSIALSFFDIKKVYSSALPVGSGFVFCEHGKLPVPVPATKELLKNIPTYKTESGHEMVTPTGAAVLTTICENFVEIHEFDLKKRIGYGAGKIKSEQPGILRVILY